tara:strand:- start:354 stop:698 length:345 start_codon:yes stop_codon:yes gene_type:complete
MDISKFTYAVRRINPETGDWELVKNHKDFQHDDKFIVQFNKNETIVEKDLIDFFVHKVETMNKGILAKKKLQINFKQETKGLNKGKYSNGDDYVKCFGVLSYAQGSNLVETLDY